MNKTLLLTLLLTITTGCVHLFVEEHEVVKIPIEEIVTMPDGTMITNVTSVPFTNKVVRVNPKVAGALGLAKEVNDSANPTPVAPLLSIVLASLSGVLGLVAKKKNGEKVKAEQYLATIVTAVEGSEVKAEVKAAVKQGAKVAGNSIELKRTVQRILANNG